MANQSLDAFLQNVGEYVSKTLPRLPAYKADSRGRIKEQLIKLLQAYPALALRVAEMAPDGIKSLAPPTQPSRLILLEGTIPIIYRGGRYNIPVSLRLPAGFPSTPPVCFVTQTAELALKPRQKAVDPGGMCQVAGFRRGEWDPHGSTLKAFASELGRLFSLEPPLYARPAGVPGVTSSPYLRGSSGGGSSDEVDTSLPPALQLAFSSGGLEETGFENLQQIAQELVKEDGVKEDAMAALLEDLAVEQTSMDMAFKKMRQLARDQFFARAKLAKVAAALPVAEERWKEARAQAEVARRQREAEETVRQEMERLQLARQRDFEEKRVREEEEERRARERVEEEMGEEAERLRREVAWREAAMARAELERKAEAGRAAEMEIREEERRLAEAARQREEEWRKRAEEQRVQERLLWEEAKRRREREVAWEEERRRDEERQKEEEERRRDEEREKEEWRRVREEAEREEKEEMVRERGIGGAHGEVEEWKRGPSRGREEERSMWEETRRTQPERLEIDKGEEVEARREEEATRMGELEHRREEEWMMAEEARRREEEVRVREEERRLWEQAMRERELRAAELRQEEAKRSAWLEQQRIEEARREEERRMWEAARREMTARDAEAARRREEQRRLEEERLERELRQVREEMLGEQAFQTPVFMAGYSSDQGSHTLERAMSDKSFLFDGESLAPGDQTYASTSEYSHFARIGASNMDPQGAYSKSAKQDSFMVQTPSEESLRYHSYGYGFLPKSGSEAPGLEPGGIHPPHKRSHTGKPYYL